MPITTRLTCTAILFLIVSTFVHAQDLENLPPVLAKTANTDTATAFLLSTQDGHHDADPNGKSYVNSVQIVEADQPWPPIWYTTTPLYTDKMFVQDSLQNINILNVLIDAKVEGGYLSFFKLRFVGQNDSMVSKPVAGYILLNKHMEPVDTVSSNMPSIYWHDFRINSRGERLVDFKVLEFLDLRRATGNSADSAVRSQTDFLHVLDKQNKSVFGWRTTDHLDPNVFQFNEALHSKSFVRNASDGDFIDWSHLTSAIWDYDGDILYCLRFIGLGKISRADGHVIWQINYKDLPITVGKDSLQWYFPHDLNLLYDNDSIATYSVYSLGNREKHSVARCVIFEMDKKTNKVVRVKYAYPSSIYYGRGQGGCDYIDAKNYLFAYGVHDLSTLGPENMYDAFEYRKADSIHTVYKLPLHVWAYKAHTLKNWPQPTRPAITKKAGLLEANGETNDFTWYKMEGQGNTKVTKVGTGKSIKPEQGRAYCVVEKYGMGYSASHIFYPN